MSKSRHSAFDASPNLNGRSTRVSTHTSAAEVSSSRKTQETQILSGPQRIAVSRLKKKYGERTVVKGVDFDVKRGEVVGLLGPNGAGKTTSFYMVMGLVRPDGGKVLLDESDITYWPMHQRAQSGIGYLAQNESIFRRLSVEDNIRAILELMPLSKAEQKARCEELLEDFSLTERRRVSGIKLSGGERRRTEIARTLAGSPAFILLDEPFTGVDPKNREEIQIIVRRLAERGIGILITDQNELATLDIVDRAYIIHKGKVEEQGTPRELMDNPRAREIYFGENHGWRTS